MVGFREFGEQPVHFVLLERHVDFDGGVAGDRGGDAGANLFQIQRLLFARKLVEQFVQHMFDRGRLHARRSDFHRYAARAKRLGLESVVLAIRRRFR